MPLWLSNEDCQRLLSPRGYVEAVEEGYRQMGLGRGAERQPPRTHTYVENGVPDARFCCRTIEGGVPSLGVYAVRMCSEVPRITLQGGMRRKYKPAAIEKRYWLGLVFLFGLEQGELRAVFQDGWMNRLLTGATGALGVKYLARQDASTLGIIGAGFQAGGQLLAIQAVRPIRHVKVFSPTPENRCAFAEQMTAELDIPVEPVPSYEDAVRGVDIVVTATNSYDAFFKGEWLEPGQHLDAMGGGDRNNPMRELDDESFRRTDVLAVNAKLTIEYDQPEDVMGAVRRGDVRWEDILELGQLVAGKAVGRTRDDQVTLHRHFSGLGLWYAAAGHALYEAAKHHGAGQQIPDEWFVQSMVT
jgi:ornithine cyclodeaminase/alanine dehydrogenase-like protein (mu-crystallin family)